MKLNSRRVRTYYGKHTNVSNQKPDAICTLAVACTRTTACVTNHGVVKGILRGGMLKECWDVWYKSWWKVIDTENSAGRTTVQPIIGLVTFGVGPHDMAWPWPIKHTAKALDTGKIPPVLSQEIQESQSASSPWAYGKWRQPWVSGLEDWLLGCLSLKGSRDGISSKIGSDWLKDSEGYWWISCRETQDSRKNPQCEYLTSWVQNDAACTLVIPHLLIAVRSTSSDSCFRCFKPQRSP